MISIDSEIFNIVFGLLFVFGIISVIPSHAWTSFWSHINHKDN